MRCHENQFSCRAEGAYAAPIAISVPISVLAAMLALSAVTVDAVGVAAHTPALSSVGILRAVAPALDLVADQDEDQRQNQDNRDDDASANDGSDAADDNNSDGTDGTDGDATDGDATNGAPGETVRIRFNFKDATVDQVIDFFSRTTGLPVVREADVPSGTIDFLSPESYELKEAMRVLNIVLQSRGVMLRLSDDMLYLRKLSDMGRAAVPTYTGEIPDDVTEDQIVTVVKPLNISMAKPMAERLKELIAEYGSVIAMEEQNSVVITETASNVRRLLNIIDELDQQDPDGDVEIIRLEYAKATEIMEPLNALLAVRETRYVIDQRGNQQKIEEDTMAGLNISPDPRTNTIVARGQQRRLQALRDTVRLLDVPAAGQNRTMRTFDLVRISPQQAQQRLNTLFSQLPEDERPTIVPIDDLSRVTLVGTEMAVDEAAALLREVDGGGEADVTTDGEPGQARGGTIALIALDHAEPGALLTAMKGLLTPRQQAVTRVLPGVDGESVIVAGSANDVAAVQSLAEVLDQPRRVDREVRLMRMTHADPAGTLNRARELYERQRDADDPVTAVDVEYDADARVLTMIGARAAVEAFVQTMRTVESTFTVDQETRQFELEHAAPSQIVRPLQTLARQLLESRDDAPGGAEYIAPQFDPVDDLDLLIVRATPEQFGEVASLIATLDRPGPDDFQFRVVSMAGSNVDTLLERASFVFERMNAGRAEPLALPDVEHDALTGNLLITGRTEAVRVYEQAMNEARRLVPPAREGRMIELEYVQAADIIQPLQDLLSRTTVDDPARQVPEPSIEVVERTNALYVVAEPAQHAAIDRHVQLLDTVEPGDLPPMRLIQVRAADVNQIADLLRRRYEARPSEQRRAAPVQVDADVATGTLIVTAHEDVYEEIRAFVSDINTGAELGPERETMIFPLRRSRAADLAAALERLYPEPPVPVDARGRPLPHLQEPKEVYVSADPGTNTLIIEAPAERRASFDALVDQLDRVELPPQARLRTYRIERGDVNEIARTLSELADRGVLSETPEDGGTPVDVLIQAEPRSRTLIVAGDDTTFSEVERMLEDLEVVPVQRSLRVFDVTGANASELADRAKRLFAEQTADMPHLGDVSIEVDGDAQSLLVVADEEAMAEFAAILNQLREAIGPPPDVRLIPLEFAEASEVVEFLRELSTGELAMTASQRGPRPTYEAIDRTNSILVAAQPQQHQIIRSLLDSLDKPETQDMPPLRILQLRAADADNLARALMSQYNQRPPEQRQQKPVSISADPNTNALIVAAHPDLLPEIQAVVADLNKTDRLDYEGREISIFPLKVARADELARTIDEMFPQPPVPVDARGRPLPHLQQPREVVVRADTQTNSLIVDAPVQRMAGFQELVEQLDRQQIGDQTQIRTYQVVHAELDTLAETLRDLASAGSLSPSGQDRRVGITIATEPVSQTLVVSGPADIFDRVGDVLEDLDVRRAGPTTSMRIFKLEYARAESLADMLRDVLRSRIVEDVPGGAADPEALLNISHDRKTNALIISAPEAVMPVAEQLIEQLDTETAAMGNPVVRIKPLTFADAQQVSQSLNDALPGIISKHTGDPIDVRLIPAAGSNALILVGVPEDLDEVESLIEPLDARPAMDAIDARTYKLTYAEAGTIAPVVERLLTDQQETDPRIILQQMRMRQGQIEATPPIRVEADERTNSLIVSGPQQTVALAETLIGQLDVADDDARRIYATFTPANAEPDHLVDTVRRVIAGTRPAGRRSTLELIAEPQSGVVVVIGREDETAQAMEMLAERDRHTPVAPPMDFQMLALEYTQAQIVAQTLTILLRDETRWPQSLRAARRAGLAVGQPSVTADARTNRLLVSAPQELMALARNVVSELDQPRDDGDGAVDVRIFTLTQANATDVADAVRTALDARADSRPGTPRPTVIAEPSSNSVLVTATPTVLAEVEAIITPLDDTMAVDRPQVRTVFLDHARADAVAPLVEQLLAGEEVPIWMRFEASRLNRDVPETGPEVRVAADTRLNAVVISAIPTVLDIAEQMVAQLDIDPAAATGAPRRTVQVLRIDNADARELATNLEAIFSEPDQLDTPPSIRVDAASNSLLVRATEAQFETIRSVVEDIDRATIATSRQMEMVQIDPSRANAEDVARTLKRLLDQSGRSGVEVITVEELIKRQNERRPAPSEPGPQSRMWPDDDSTQRAGAMQAAPQQFVFQYVVGLLGHAPMVLAQDAPNADADADADADALGGTDAEADDTDDDRSAGSNASDADVTIAVDPDTNSLIIIGAPRMLERVTALARQIEAELPGRPGTLRYIPLPQPPGGVEAQSVAQLINQTMRQMAPMAGAAGNLAARVSVLADPVNNALIVSANDRDFETVGELVALLSQPVTSEQMLVKVYPLESITAERAAESVRSLIAPDDAQPQQRRRRGRQEQRMRELAVQLLVDGQAIDAVFDPNRVRINTDVQGNALIVMGPSEAIAFVDQYIELIDQTPMRTRATLKMYQLQHARAGDLQSTLRSILQSRFRAMQRQLGPGAITPEFTADERTNTLLVTASPEMFSEVDALIEDLDVELAGARHPLTVIELTSAPAEQAAQMLERVVLGSDQDRRASTQIVPSDEAGVLLVRASEATLAEIRQVLSEIDRDAARDYPVRTITLERANAGSVSQAIQRFYDDRAQIAGARRGRRAQRQVSVIGDPNTNMLLVAASENDFEEIEQIVAQFDSPAAAGAPELRIYELQHARATEIENTVTQLVDDLTWGQGPMFFFGGGQFGGMGRNTSGPQGTVAVRADARLNALIATGQGDRFSIVEQVVEVLDVPPPADAQRVVRLYRVQNAQLDVVSEIVSEAHTTQQQRRWWEPADPNEPQVRTDQRTNTLIVSATEKQQREIAELIESIDSEVGTVDRNTEVLAVEFGRASEFADTLRQFMQDSARASGGPQPSATIVASDTANTLIVSAEPADLTMIRDLLSRLDTPDASGDRIVEIVALREGGADEIARIIREQFGRRSTGGVGGLVITPDVRTNSLIINAPPQQFAQAKALIDQLDVPEASDETIVRIYSLEGARAEDAMRILTETLQLDAGGQQSGISIRLDEESEPVQVKAKITADRRSNSVYVTATDRSFPVIEKLINEIDSVKPVSPVEYRLMTLEHAVASEVVYTLNQFWRNRRDEGPAGIGAPSIDYNSATNQLIIQASADQFEQLERIIDEIDQPSSQQRRTDFVPLEFAEAEQVREALSFFFGPYAPGAETAGQRNARIVADPATNSLVISADEGEWEAIRALLEKLDSEEYDATLQLRVLPLTYADARSVASAINNAFQNELQRPQRGQQRQPEQQQQRGRDDEEYPTVLVAAEDWVRAAAEPQTNSIIVSASRQNMTKIELIISQLDVADFAKLPPPQIIPVGSGDPNTIAQSLQQLYEATERSPGARGVRIVPDRGANAIIVRADADEFDQIRALAEALQQQAGQQGLSVHVLTLAAAPAGRVATAIRQAYEVKAQQSNTPLSVQVDASGNSLIIASTRALFEEIEQTVEELDRLAPAAGQGIFIIELENISPDAAKAIIETIGLDQPPRDDTVRRMVSEPVRVVPLVGRRAIMLIANPADRETLVALLKAVDDEPELAEAQMRVVRLEQADAEALVDLLEEILDPGDQQADTPLARAVQEQVRRLAIRRDGLKDEDIALDLTMPVRLIADAGINAVVISSTASNVAALVEIVKLFDGVPVNEAATVQIFALQNIAADQFARIIRELFDQGRAISRVPGTDREAVPVGVVGRALLDEVAISVDERTNTVIVAGKEDAVALVEVMSQRLDTDVTTGWVEPRIISLTHADATDLAEMLNAVVVDGASNLPQASPLQRQIGRLRMMREEGDNGARKIEGDIFQPMTRLVIRPESQLNALVLVGTPRNLDLIAELVTMLDIEAASPSATVQIYPVEHASAARLAETITRLFDQQAQAKAIRPEDRVIVQADERTNALIVTTSPRSFAVLENLLNMLDAEVAPDLREIRTVEVRNASATRLASLVQQMMDARLERMRRVQPETADLERATVIADPRTNALLIAAGNESYDVIRRLVEDLDRDNLPDASLVNVIPMTTGNVDRIADAIDQIMQRRYADMPADMQQSQRPLVLTDPRSNSLLVAANPEDVDVVRDLVRTLESAPSSPAVGVHVISVDTSSGGRVDDLAPRLQQLMRERQQTLGPAETPSDRVTIQPYAPTNSLIVAASHENLEVINGLINAISSSERAALGDDVAIMTLRNSRADQIVPLLNSLYVNEANRTRGQDVVRVTADNRLNAVVVNAPTSDVAALRSLVERLDGTRPSTVTSITTIPLSSANALEIVNLIENVLSGRGIGATRSTQQATVIQYLRKVPPKAEDLPEIEDLEDDAQVEMAVSAAIRESITLVPDLRTNAVIVNAPADSLAVIEQMIRDLDQSSIGAQDIRVFQLVNADAQAMARVLSDLFNLQQQGELFVLKPREAAPVDPEAPVGTPEPGVLGRELTAVPDQRQQLSITVDSRTNSLLVSGTPTYLGLVGNVVTELDAKEANERESFVYPLKNAVATEVASVVSQFVDQEQEKLISTLGSDPDQLGSAARLLEREITIVGDEKSNTVLVSASPRYTERVRAVIDQLDVDPPQVLIQVLLAEVTLDSLDEWGVDFSGEGQVGSASVTGGYGLGSAVVTGMGVPNLAIASSDFELIIRAMRSQGRLQVLSNPSIMAANNEEARIQVGETLRLPTVVSVGELGNTNTSVEPEEVGVILTVRPSINPDGFVRMQINPEISNLSARTTRISEDFEAPIITRRVANTTVTVKDGQTVVIGGLISNRFERRDRKVPILGDIPILGALFRAETEETAKTELLIVLTPHVIQSPTDRRRVDELTAREIDRLSLPEEVKDSIRKGAVDQDGALFDAQGNPIRIETHDDAADDDKTDQQDNTDNANNDAP